MNFPVASPNENKKIDSSMSPMPASRAERSSAGVDILVSKLMGFLPCNAQSSSTYQVRRNFLQPQGRGANSDQTWNGLPRQHCCDIEGVIS
jgi:hypothetical protein